jgi:hypothetical protein
MGKDGPGPYAASAYGLTGSLGQGFVISTAIAVGSSEIAA